MTLLSLDVVLTASQQLQDHSAEVASNQRRVVKPSTNVARMAYQLQQVQRGRDALPPSVNKRCLDAALMGLALQKGMTSKVARTRLFLTIAKNLNLDVVLTMLLLLLVQITKGALNVRGLENVCRAVIQSLDVALTTSEQQVDLTLLVVKKDQGLERQRLPSAVVQSMVAALTARV